MATAKTLHEGHCERKQHVEVFPQECGNLFDRVATSATDKRNQVHDIID